MGKIGTKTRTVAWPSWEEAKFWGEEMGHPPYVTAQDIPAGYGFWGETITILHHDELKGYRFQARAYFLPLAALKRMGNEPRGPSQTEDPILQDVPLKWILFEPSTAFNRGQPYVRIMYDPRSTWFFDVVVGGQNAPPFVMSRPKHRILTESAVTAYQKSFRRAVQKALKAQKELQDPARMEQAERQQAVREARAEEAPVAAKKREEIRALASEKRSSGDDDADETVPLVSPTEASQRFSRAEQIVDNAVTEDDIKRALEIVTTNQLLGGAPDADKQRAQGRNDRFIRKVGDQLVRLMDEAIEVLQARYQELPDSPLREWRADLARLQRLHGEYHGTLRYPPYQPAVDSMIFWHQKIRQLEKQRSKPAGQQGRPTRRQRGLAHSRPDPAIGSEERGLQARARAKRTTGISNS